MGKQKDKKKAGQVAILHLLPLEKYPPVMNFIRTLEQADPDCAVKVYTSYPDDSGIQLFVPSGPRVEIIRGGKRPASPKGFSGMLHRVGNLLRITGSLIRNKPSAILYYETFSVFPVWLMGLLTGWKSRILIHYHEYVSPAEIRNAPAMFRVFSRIELGVWPRAVWISHTHPLRMQQFVADYPGILPAEALQVIPNYPPGSWSEPDGLPRAQNGKRLVYVGVLGLETMYLPEVCAWLEGPGQSFTLDIYAFQVHPDVRAFLHRAGNQRIRLHSGVDYFSLPAILRQYDTGLVLYKGHIPNFVMIAPNKLFEYLSCGLEVWLPKQMVGSLPYVNDAVNPRVLAVDFENLNAETPRLLPPEEAMPARKEVYICEEAFQPLIAALTQKS